GFVRAARDWKDRAEARRGRRANRRIRAPSDAARPGAHRRYAPGGRTVERKEGAAGGLARRFLHTRDIDARRPTIWVSMVFGRGTHERWQRWRASGKDHQRHREWRTADVPVTAPGFGGGNHRRQLQRHEPGRSAVGSASGFNTSRV